MKFSQFLAENSPVTTESNSKIKFVPYDANYFSHGVKNKDCVIRALSKATNIGYKKLMEMFGKFYMLGRGYPPDENGISIEEVDKFAEKTGIIKKIWGDDETYSNYMDIMADTRYDSLQFPG